MADSRQTALPGAIEYLARLILDFDPSSTDVGRLSLEVIFASKVVYAISLWQAGAAIIVFAQAGPWHTLNPLMQIPPNRLRKPVAQTVFCLEAE